jgi:hypothetical protein
VGCCVQILSLLIVGRVIKILAEAIKVYKSKPFKAFFLLRENRNMLVILYSAKFFMIIIKKY